MARETTADGSSQSATARAIGIVDGATHRVEAGLNVISLAALTIILVVEVGEVIGRYGFNRPIPGSYELAALMLVTVVYLPLAYVQSQRSHVQIDILRSRLSSHVRAYVDVAVSLIAIVVVVAVLWGSYLAALKSFSAQEASATLNTMPIWPTRFMVPLGLGLFSVRLSFDLARAVKTLVKKVE